MGWFACVPKTKRRGVDWVLPRRAAVSMCGYVYVFCRACSGSSSHTQYCGKLHKWIQSESRQFVQYQAIKYIKCSYNSTTSAPQPEHHDLTVATLHGDVPLVHIPQNETQSMFSWESGVDPCWRKTSATSVFCQSDDTKSSGVVPPSSLVVTSAPCSRSMQEISARRCGDI